MRDYFHNDERTRSCGFLMSRVENGNATVSAAKLIPFETFYRKLRMYCDGDRGSSNAVLQMSCEKKKIIKKINHNRPNAFCLLLHAKQCDEQFTRPNVVGRQLPVKSANSKKREHEPKRKKKLFTRVTTFTRFDAFDVQQQIISN